ncbi:MAG: hypothetical protein D6714_02115 [Bacteroidetes bacterium]|nr:MAG: hypothetical protein D6714_02115 [Bacteroidota bacterium]
MCRFWGAGAARKINEWHDFTIFPSGESRFFGYICLSCNFLTKLTNLKSCSFIPLKEPAGGFSATVS